MSGNSTISDLTRFISGEAGAIGKTVSTEFDFGSQPE